MRVAEEGGKADGVFDALMPGKLTAIVVGVATLALGLAIVVRIREEYDSIDEDEILDLDKAGDKSR